MILKAREEVNNKLDYIDFYKYSMSIGDVDPAYPAIKFVCQQLGLSKEQIYWWAFLFGTTYSLVTSFHMLLEFPDHTKLDRDKMYKWWNQNFKVILFQSDRRRDKIFDRWYKMAMSYQNVIGQNQHEFYSNLMKENNTDSYLSIIAAVKDLYYFGQFNLFNMTQILYEVAGLDIKPHFLDLRLARSCRNAMCYVSDNQDMIWQRYKTQQNEGKKEPNYEVLNKELIELHDQLHVKFPEFDVTYWNIETSLCAFKKLQDGKRYLGYYIDRQLEELIDAQKQIKQIDWEIFWIFRQKHFHPSVLGQKNDWQGVRSKNMKLFSKQRIYADNFSQNLYQNIIK